MADAETASGLPVLSAFDQLKLSSSNNNFIINRNTSCSNVNLSNRTQIDKSSHSNSVVDVKTSIAASVSAALATSAVATENQKCEKSISLPLAQFECNNKKPIVMFGSSEINATYTSSSACENRRASGYSSLPHPLSSSSSSSTIASTKSEKTIQIICGASDMNGAALSFTPSLSVSSSSSSLSPSSSSSSPPLLTPLSTSSISPSPSLATITMVLPNNSVNTGNFDMFSTTSQLLSSSSLTVQNKMKKIDANEVSIKMLKSGKCKTSVSVSPSVVALTTPAVAAQSPQSPPTMRQLKTIASKSPAIICAPPPMVLPIQSNKFANSSASNKKSNPKGKNQNFGFPMLPGTVPSATAAAKKQSTNVDSNKKRQSSTTEKTEHATTDDRNKKKRCSDRYDSSESSDSGVATSLSCTDSSTASSDVSDPGSPYSPVLLGDDLQHKLIMPPQTILATTNGNAAKSPTTGAATPVQNVLKGGKQQQKHQNQSEHKSITPQQPRKNGKAQISSQKVTHHIWPWTSLHTIEDIAKSTCNNKTANNKRHSQVSSTPTDGGAKKTRTTNSNIIDSSAALPPLHIAQNGKRLKAAAMEESQTKITGYFKSQMKAQIHQSGLKKDTMAHILPSNSSPSITVTAVPSTSSSSSLTSSSSPLCNVTTASSNCSQMNNYFNLLTSQLKKEQERTASIVPVMPILPQALKKIERSKPTKIAQVAPNLRKTTAAPQQSAQAMEKSPPKKHVPIAPRTADIRSKHELAMSSPIKAPQHQPQLQQQPSVLLTAIRIPQPNQPPHLVPTSPQNANGSCPKPPQQNGAPAAATCPSKVSTGPSLYQIPMMPNLVQFPNLLATNVSQLTGARSNHSHHPTAQYLFNGTVFKLQQFSGPPTGNNPPTFSIENGNQSVNAATVNTTATAIEHASNNKNTSSITATNLQEMLSNQFQTQQQQQQQSVAAAHNHRMHHSQQVFMATTTGLLLNAASLPMLGNKQAMSIQPQQIPALQPIQGASAMMPGLSSIFSSHQEVSAQQLHQYKSEQVAFSDTHTPPPPLQPTTHIPPLSVSSSAFSKLTLVNAAGAFTPSVHQVSATQPPPLVTISSGSQSVTVSTKATSNKPSVNNKPYQKKSAKQETAKSKNNAESTKNPLPPLVAPISAVALQAPVKSPPALAYPSLIIPKDVQTRTEDLFDLIKNSKNETTIAPLPMLYTPAEKLTEEPISTTYAQPPSPAPPSVEIEDPLSLSSIPSSAPASPEALSNSTAIAKLVDSPDSSCSLETSLASSSLISAESPNLLIDLKPEQETETSTSLSVSEKSPSTDSLLSTLTPVDTALADSDTLPKSAISPILSQPKTIRFPPNGCRFGPKGMRRHDGVCYWDKCNKKHESSSKLLDHMQTHHVNSQTGPFACLWLGCKVYGRESCSRRWLERHVLSHGGTKPFKCIVDGCGLRFGSQLALQKHVNGHFTATENKDSTNKRTSDPPVPKLLRKNGKKLRYRRQPFSARMFDFFDTGIMEGLNHRLRQISTLTNGNNSITFQGEIIMRRKTKGIVECYVQWSPPKIISNEWLPESCMPYVKTLPINRMQPNEKTNVESLLNSAYRLPYSPNLFQSFHSLSRQNSQDSNTSLQDNSQSTATTSTTTATTTTADENSRGSSIDNPSLSSISKLPLKLPQMELRQKQSRKPPKRIQPS